MTLKLSYVYWIVPVSGWIPQLFMTLNSFSQVRYEEFITSVQAPYWFYHHQIVGGLHVNVGWYAYLVILYKLFGFTLFTGRIAYLFISLFSLFVLSYILKSFFNLKTATLILITLALSPTWLFINSLNMHMAMTYHILLIILLILIKIDFHKKRLSLILTGVLSFLIMVCVLTYQAATAFIPSLFIFYWLKYRSHLRGEGKAISGVYLGGVAAVAFLLPVVMLFLWVENKQMLILDPERNTGLFRGGGQFMLSGDVFSQNWTNFLKDFFIKGVSHHFEVAQAEFSLVFPIITILFLFYAIRKIYASTKSLRKIIMLVFLVMTINSLVFSFSNALALAGMHRATPILLSIYFLWIIVWYYLDKIKTKSPHFKAIGVIILSLFLLHHLIVYPINLSYLKEPSPFKVADWFGEENPQHGLEKFVDLVHKQDLPLDCRTVMAYWGTCFYDFIYPSVAGSCEWNNFECHQILGYDGKDNTFVPLSIGLWQNKFFER